jgi:hypothetical protein
LEALEGRCVPSTLKVTSLLDSGKGSLRYDIAQAKSGDTIVFDKKLDGGTITLTSGELLINENLTIQGPGAGLMTITSQPEGFYQYSSRIFDVRGGTVALSGLTISNGGGVASALSPHSDPYDFFGGGVLNLGTLTISGCTLSNNHILLGDGGGIYNAGTLTVSGCALTGNSAYSGGGIYNGFTMTGGPAHSGTLTVSGCTLSGNSAAPATGANDGVAIAEGGGGICNDTQFGPGGRGTVAVLDSIFSGNTPDNIAGSYTDGGGNTFK